MNHSTLLSAALIGLCSSMACSAQTGTAPLPSGAMEWELRQSGRLEYLVQLPEGYSSEDSQKKWPLMLFLHGVGERGGNVQLAAVHGPLREVREGKRFPFIIVAPQCPQGQIWQNEPLIQLLNHVEEKYRVDTNRVYLTGLSMGGFGAWSFGLRYPERFAALAPICGGGSIIEIVIAGPEYKAALLKLPVWTFHGAKDPVVPLSESERMVSALRKLGKQDNLKFTIYPEAEHDAWTETYRNPEFYEWLLAQKRQSD